jgi:hypothetical protein
VKGDFSVSSARFELLPRPLGPGWIMRVTAGAKNIGHFDTPFVARLGEQHIEFLCVSTPGDLFEGYLRRTPKPGDRLFVGYSVADVPTSVVFGQEERPPIS